MLLAVGLTLAQHWSLYDQAKRTWHRLAKTLKRPIAFNRKIYTWHAAVVSDDMFTQSLQAGCCTWQLLVSHQANLPWLFRAWACGWLDVRRMLSTSHWAERGKLLREGGGSDGSDGTQHEAYRNSPRPHGKSLDLASLGRLGLALWLCVLIALRGFKWLQDNSFQIQEWCPLQTAWG